MKRSVLVATLIAILIFCLLPIRYSYAAPFSPDSKLFSNFTNYPYMLPTKDGKPAILAFGNVPLIIGIYKVTFDKYNGLPKLDPQHPMYDYAIVAFIAWLVTFELLDVYARKKSIP